MKFQMHIYRWVYKYSEKSMHPFLITCVDKIMSTDGGQTDGQAEAEAPPQKKSFARVEGV